MFRAAAFWFSVGSFLIPFLANAEDKRHIPTFDELAALKTPRDVQISPDGRTILFGLDESLWKLETSGSRQPEKLTTCSSPVWSADSRRVACLRRERDGKDRQLIVVDAGSGQVRPIQRMNGEISQYRFSPEGTHIAVVGFIKTPRVESAMAAEPRSTQSPIVLSGDIQWNSGLGGLFPAGSRGGDDPAPTRLKSHLYVVSIETEHLELLLPDELYCLAVDWSPDGKRIAFVAARASPDEGYGPRATDIGIVDHRKDITWLDSADSAKKVLLRWSPDGAHIAYAVSGSYDVPRAGVYSLRSMSSMDATRNVGGWAQASRGLEWTRDGNELIAIQRDFQGSQVLIAVRPETGEFRHLSELSRSVVSFSVSDQGSIAWIESSPTEPYSIRLLRPKAESSSVLYSPNPQVRNWILGEQQVVHWTSHGRRHAGILIKPPDFQEGRRYPAIISCYPIRVNDFRGVDIDGSTGQAWAARGYVVFYPGTPAAWHWYTFRNTERTKYKGPEGIRTMIDDIVSGVDALVARGIVDPQRVCLHGFSNGGGVVNFAAAESDRFRCAVSRSGVHINTVDAYFTYNASRNIFELIVGANPYESPTAFTAYSSLFRMNRSKTPMLLAVGDLEGPLVLSHVQLYKALRQLGVEGTLVRYPNEGHVLSMAARRDFFLRELAFFDHHLKPHHRQH